MFLLISKVYGQSIHLTHDTSVTINGKDSSVYVRILSFKSPHLRHFFKL